MAVMSKRKILVVEDNDLNRSLLCEILKPEYDVVEAENGREALERLRQYAGDFSLILLDIVMPVMDGYEFLAAIKEDQNLTPFRSLSPHRMMESQKRWRLVLWSR